MPEKTATPKRQAINARAAIWDKKNTTRLHIDMNIHADADIISHLDALSNKQGYIKRLIREDIARNSF